MPDVGGCSTAPSAAERLQYEYSQPTSARGANSHGHDRLWADDGPPGRGEGDAGCHFPFSVQDHCAADDGGYRRARGSGDQPLAATDASFTIIWIVIAAALSREYRRRSHRTSLELMTVN